MLQAGIDGDQSVVLWYQPYWDIVKQILADTKAAPHMTYGFVPEHDPVTKERRYGGFCSAMWMEAAMREALMSIRPLLMRSLVDWYRAANEGREDETTRGGDGVGATVNNAPAG